LKEYIQKGFVLNDNYPKNGRPFGRDYFNELLECIREIRHVLTTWKSVCPTDRLSKAMLLSQRTISMKLCFFAATVLAQCLSIMPSFAGGWVSYEDSE
jgi:hypothetical protein